jgi:hypothetical protein
VTDLTALISRLKEAEAGSADLDTEIAIALAFGGHLYPGRPLGSFKAGYVQADLGRDGWSVGWSVPPFTASLDAALALVESKLPGWLWAGGTVGVFEGGEAALMTLHPPPDDAEAYSIGRAATPALAALIALLTALESQHV